MAKRVERWQAEDGSMHLSEADADARNRFLAFATLVRGWAKDHVHSRGYGGVEEIDDDGIWALYRALEGEGTVFPPSLGGSL